MMELNSTRKLHASLVMFLNLDFMVLRYSRRCSGVNTDVVVLVNPKWRSHDLAPRRP